MNRNLFNFNDSPGVMEFLAANPVFMAALIVCCVFLAFTVALRLSGVSERWERRTARGLIISAVPVAVWMISFAFPFFNPWSGTKIVWGIFLLKYIFDRTLRRSRQERRLAKEKKWRCPECGEINEDMFLHCAKCDYKRILPPEKTDTEKPGSIDDREGQ